MKGSADESRSGLGMLAAGVALLAAFCMIVALLVVIIDEDDCLTPDLGVDVNLPAKPVAVGNRTAPLTARVASWNTLYSNSTSRVNAGLRTIAGTADVIGVQELWAGKRGPTERSMAKIGWAVSDGNSAVRIFYNARKYKLLAEGNEKVLGTVRIEGGTAGHSIGPKSVQWVQLQDRDTGATFFVVNHHIVPDIDRKGHPRKGAPRRLQVYRTQMAGMLSLVGKLRPYGPVAVTGDHNVDARRDQQVKNPTFPYVLMRSARIASNWAVLGTPKRGTQTSGQRLIDYVWLTQESGRFLSQRILGAYGSDHHAVVASISNRASTNPTNPPVSTSPTARPSQAALPASLRVPGWTLDAQQIQIAATAIEVGREFNIPERGWIVAIASGMQESGLRNLDGGDRDSVGWQQQRPSAGWGTVAEIRNVRMATMAFYGVATHTDNPGLTDIRGWQQMSIAEAAQAVQVSAFPSAYAKHETAARAIVAQLKNAVAGGTGVGDSGACAPQSTGGDTGNCPATGLAVEAGLTPDALILLRCVKRQFPQLTDFGGVRADPLPDHPSGRAVDFMIPDYQSSEGKAYGWQVARWVKDHRVELGVQYVIFDAHIWSVERNDEGWRSYSPGYTGSLNDSSMHRNHVHVTVYGNRAKPTGPADTTPGKWHTPIGNPYSVGCGFHCYRNHNGQDFPAAPGTPVYALNDAIVVRSESILAGGRRCSTLPICGRTRVSYGNLIVLQLAGGDQVTVWYAHLSERRVRVGDTVRAGQVIGTVGFQGHVIPQGPRGSHLHLEIRREGTPMNPMPYLRGKGIQA